LASRKINNCVFHTHEYSDSPRRHHVSILRWFVFLVGILTLTTLISSYKAIDEGMMDHPEAASVLSAKTRQSSLSIPQLGEDEHRVYLREDQASIQIRLRIQAAIRDGRTAQANLSLAHRLPFHTESSCSRDGGTERFSRTTQSSGADVVLGILPIEGETILPQRWDCR